METARAIHIAMEIWGVIFMILAYFTEWLGRASDKEKGVRIRGMIFSGMLLLACDALAWAFRGETYPMAIVMTRFSNIMVFLMYVMIEDVFISFIRISSGEDAKWIKICKNITFGLLIAFALVLIINIVFPFLYTFDDTNHYYRLPAFPLTFIPAFIGLGVVVYVGIRVFAKLRIELRVALLVSLGMGVISAIIQLLFYGISFSVLGVSVAILMVTLTHQIEKSKDLLQRENELKELKMQQLRAQMQPHFLFNSLTTIRSLIRRDPDEAYMAVSDFSKFLRGSLTALQDVKNWSIEQELQMVEGYLSLEHRRFGNQLIVTMDIQDTAFEVPTLSVQTLVENAVRHGLRGKTTGDGHLILRTQLENNAHFVYIIDDGVGFDPKKPHENDGRVHTGLQNTQKRIEDLGGEMIIDSAINEGTTIILKIL